MQKKKTMPHQHYISTNFSKCSKSLFLAPSTPEEISNIIKSLSNYTATRTDNVYEKFIKLSNAIISPVLCKILNLSIVNEEFLDDMKIAEVVPTYKRADLSECSNYRRISLL